MAGMILQEPKKKYKNPLKHIINNFFQIIAGEYRDRRFSFPSVDSLRPTPNKVRETLFNWIQFESYNKTYLDLFSGSGALSFEALSRGAKQVVSIESNLEAFQSIKKNLKSLKSDKMQVINQNAFKFLTKISNQTFDFVFIDPPFKENYLPKLLQTLVKGGFVDLNSKIYVESNIKLSTKYFINFCSQEIKINKQKHSGQVHYCLITLQ